MCKDLCLQRKYPSNIITSTGSISFFFLFFGPSDGLKGDVSGRENRSPVDEGGVFILEGWGAVVSSVGSNDAGGICHLVTGDI